MSSRLPIPSPKAKAYLTGRDGNIFAIMGRAIKGMKHAGYSDELITQYEEEVTKGDYWDALAVTLEYVDDHDDDSVDPRPCYEHEECDMEPCIYE